MLWRRKFLPYIHPGGADAIVKHDVFLHIDGVLKQLAVVLQREIKVREVRDSVLGGEVILQVCNAPVFGDAADGSCQGIWTSVETRHFVSERAVIEYSSIRAAGEPQAVCLLCQSRSYVVAVRKDGAVDAFGVVQIKSGG